MSINFGKLLKMGSKNTMTNEKLGAYSMIKLLENEALILQYKKDLGA